mmetsp:Transcript_42901/g.134820  ORF Transcript_42901/g.134820 Transcript_42901/m.134820 type:complete len:304 (-) Transcript_42901:42-953(-)
MATAEPDRPGEPPAGPPRSDDGAGREGWNTPRARSVDAGSSRLWLRQGGGSSCGSSLAYPPPAPAPVPGLTPRLPGDERRGLPWPGFEAEARGFEPEAVEQRPFRSTPASLQGPARRANGKDLPRRPPCTAREAPASGAGLEQWVHNYFGMSLRSAGECCPSRPQTEAAGSCCDRRCQRSVSSTGGQDSSTPCWPQSTPARSRSLPRGLPRREDWEEFQMPWCTEPTCPRPCCMESACSRCTPRGSLRQGRWEEELRGGPWDQAWRFFDCNLQPKWPLKVHACRSRHDSVRTARARWLTARGG